jgi:putative exosortase-associated protein (TIGR04073 family)
MSQALEKLLQQTLRQLLWPGTATLRGTQRAGKNPTENPFTPPPIARKFLPTTSFMSKSLRLMGSLAVLAILVAGCSSMEQKMGRGIANTTEIVRLGEMNRSIEQGGLFNGPDVGIATGVAHGFDRTIARTAVGVYEIVTFPLPPYRPVFTNYLNPRPQFPDTYKPSKWATPVFDTDHSMGFSGGDIAPWFPGSRFRVFDN